MVSLAQHSRRVVGLDCRPQLRLSGARGRDEMAEGTFHATGMRKAGELLRRPFLLAC